MAFQGILGQNKAIALLDRALHTGRLAHAYLFSGPDGVGKTTTAMALAATLLCDAEPEQRPCGNCGGCRKFASENHPDFLFIEPDGLGIKINQVRGLKKALSFSPLTARQRVIVLQDVQTMRREAGNSLLKLLEEPPADNILLLLASDGDPVLPTVVSRCQLIPFTPLPLVQAAAIIRKNCPDYDEQQALSLAALANGCPGQAAMLAEGKALALREEIVASLLAGDPEAAAQKVTTALHLASVLAALTDELQSVFGLLRIFFKEVMVSRLTERGLDSEASGTPDAVLAARERWSFQQLSDKIRALDFADHALKRNCNRGLVCEVLLLDLFGDPLDG